MISRIPGSTFSTKGIDLRLAAEARFIRAFIYERMLFVYGDVALVTAPQGVDFFPKRTDRKQVFDFVVAELTEIANQLPEDYDGSEKGRITKWAALALLARTNLDAIGWHPNPSTLYAQAEAACSQVISFWSVCP